MASKWAGIFARLGRKFVQFGDSQDKDGAGRLRVSLPKNLFSIKFEYTKDSHFFDEKVTGAAVSTHLPDESSVLMSVPNSGDELIRQSSVWKQYQPFNSQEAVDTYVFGSHETDILKEVGYSSGDDGFSFRQDGGKYWIVYETSTSGSRVEIAVPQEDWNVDKLNGGNKTDNPSGRNADLSKFTVGHIGLVWLGGDRVRVACKIDGNLITVHEFLFANNIDKVYMKTASLPVRYRIKNNGNASGGTMKQVCSVVRSEGGEEVFGVQQVARVYNLPVIQATFHAADAAGIVKPNYASFTPLLILRPRALFHGQPNHGQMRVVEFEITVKGNTPVHWALLHNPTLAVDPSYTPIKLEGAGVVQPSLGEYATGTAAVNTITNEGHPHNAGDASSDVKGDVSSGSEITSSIILVRGTFDASVDADSDKYCLAVAGDGGVVAQVSAALREAEIF